MSENRLQVHRLDQYGGPREKISIEVAPLCVERQLVEQIVVQKLPSLMYAVGLLTLSDLYYIAPLDLSRLLHNEVPLRQNGYAALLEARLVEKGVIPLHLLTYPVKNLFLDY